MTPTSRKNLRTFAAANSIWAIVGGIMGPFYILQVNNLSDGMEKMGFAFSIMILFRSASSYVTGRVSDRCGRKVFLFLAAYIQAIVIFLYTVITTTSHLFILQALMGVTDGSLTTIKTCLLGDITRKEKRGTVVGGFDAVVSLSSAIGLALGGYIVKFYGLKSVFYITSVVIVLSTAVLFFIKEDAEAAVPPEKTS